MGKLWPIGWKVIDCGILVEMNIITSICYLLSHIYLFINTRQHHLLIFFPHLQNGQMGVKNGQMGKYLKGENGENGQIGK